MRRATINTHSQNVVLHNLRGIRRTTRHSQPCRSSRITSSMVSKVIVIFDYTEVFVHRISLKYQAGERLLQFALIEEDEMPLEGALSIPGTARMSQLRSLISQYTIL